MTMEEMNTTPNEEIVKDMPEQTNEKKPAEVSANYSTEKLNSMSCPELVDAIALLTQQEKLPTRKEIDALKNAFERKKHFYAAQENDTQKALYEEAEIHESRLKDLVASFKERYKAFIAEQQREQEENFEKKTLLLERLKNIINSDDDFDTIRAQYSEFITEWRGIGFVPEAKYSDLQNEYIHLNETFYDLKKINDEFRSYDFKKNLEAKRELIEQAKKLSEDKENILVANKELQELHRQWKETGPVEKEIREEIWKEFNEYSKSIHTQIQAHFDNKKEIEVENLEKKKAICEKIEATDFEKLTRPNHWSDATKEIIALQAEWKTIGLVPKANNEEIYTRYRAACDFFFNNKESFFKKMHDEYSVNIEAKKKIIEKAQELSTSTDWNNTARHLKALQADWKKSGPVPRKMSDELWKEFRTACDTFFTAMKENNAGKSSEQLENLKKKKELIAKAETLIETLENLSADEIKKESNEIIKEFNATGHVPFKEKQKIYDRFHGAIDKIFEKAQLSRNQEKVNSFEAHIDELIEAGDTSTVRQEITNMTRFKNRAEAELATKESNMGLFTSNTKWGDSMLKEIDIKQDRLRRELKVVDQKIRIAKQKLKELREKAQE